MLPAKTVTGNVLHRIFAELRVGETTVGPGQHTKNVITIDQLFFLRDDLNSIVAAKLVLKHYKQ